MTTGDLKNNLRKFHAELKLINYENELDIVGLGCGKPSAFLPILHFVTTEFSFELAQYFFSKDYELLGKNDKNFVSVVYRILRDEFHTKSPLTKEQFFTLGFAERKLQFATSVIQLCRTKSDVLKPRKRKNVLGSSAAKSSKMNIHIAGKTTAGSTTCSTKNSNGTICFDNDATFVSKPTNSSALNVSRAKLDNAVISKQATGSSESGNWLTCIPNKRISKGQTLEDHVDILAEPEDGIINDDQDSVPRKLQDCRVARVERNMHYDSVHSRTKALTSTNRLPLKNRHWDSTFRDNTSRNPFPSKENTCPNAGNNAAGLNTQPEMEQSIMFSPIPLSSRMANAGGPQSKNEMRTKDPSSIPFVNYSRRPECQSEHIFLSHLSVGVQNPLGNDGVNMSPDQYFQDYAKLLDYVKEQERRINLLEKEAMERNSRFNEEAEKNSRLNARVIVLETAVALIQEKLES